MALGTRKLRSYFEGLTSYLGVQKEGIDSLAMMIDPDDTAAEATQGLVKLSTDAKAIDKDNDDADTFSRCVKPSQLSEPILENGASHTDTTPVVEIGAIKLTPVTFDDGTDTREDWKLEIVTGKPTSVPNTADLNVLAIDTADDNGLYLKADDTEFQETANKLTLKTGGIALTKIAVGTNNTVAVFGAAGILASGTATLAQVNALAAIGNASVVVTDGSGLLIAHATLTIAQMEVLDGVTAGITTANKALVVDGSKQLDQMDTPLLYLNGVLVSSTATEINKLDGVVAGTATASKALVVGASKDIDELDIATTFKIGGTTVTATGTELNLMDGVTASTAELNKSSYLSTVTSDVQTQIDNATLDAIISNNSSDIVLTGGSNKKQTFDITAGSYSATFPLANSVANGFTFYITFRYASGTNTLTFTRSGSDGFGTLTGLSATSFVLTAVLSNQRVYTVTSNGIATWDIM